MSIESERKTIEERLLSEKSKAKVEEIDYLAETYSGEDWYQLSHAEEEVFQLKLEDMPRLVAVHELYYDAVRITSQIPEERVDAIREELPWLSDCVVCEGEWQRFAALFGISSRQAGAFCEKYHFWDVRQGHIIFRDEQNTDETRSGVRQSTERG